VVLFDCFSFVCCRHSLVPSRDVVLLHLDLMVCLYFQVLNGHLTNYALINNNLLFISNDMIMKLKMSNSERSYKKKFCFASLQTLPSPEQMVQCNLSSRFTPRHSTGAGREHSLRPGTKTLRGCSRAQYK